MGAKCFEHALKVRPHNPSRVYQTITCALTTSLTLSNNESLLLRTPADRVKTGNHFRRKLQRSSRKILAKMVDRRRPRNEQDIGRPLKQPGECCLHWGSLQRCRHRVKFRRLQRAEA